MAVILLDVDGVCADFTGMVRERANDVCHGAVPDVVTEWGFIKALPRAARMHVDSCLTQAWPWESMRQIPDAKRAVDAFRYAKHRVVFVTSPWESCPKWAHTRAKWLGHNMGAVTEDVVVTSGKDVVAGDIFIDDKPENVAKWSAFGGGRSGGFLWDAPYNQGANHARMCGGWTDANIQRVLDFVSGR